jgi:hypothetical protein
MWPSRRCRIRHTESSPNPAASSALLVSRTYSTVEPAYKDVL